MSTLDHIIRAIGNATREGTLVLSVALVWYFLPTIIAIYKKQSPILVFFSNLLAGWIFFWWIGLFVLILSAPNKRAIDNLVDFS